VRFNSLEIFFTDNFSREYCFKDRRSFFVHSFRVRFALGDVFVAESSYLGPINPTSGTVPLIYVLLDEVEDWCHTVHFQGLTHSPSPLVYIRRKRD
jgi:hypothetical protein